MFSWKEENPSASAESGRGSSGSSEGERWLSSPPGQHASAPWALRLLSPGRARDRDGGCCLPQGRGEGAGAQGSKPAAGGCFPAGDGDPKAQPPDCPPSITLPITNRI